MRATGDWQRLKAELDSLPAVEASLVSLCDSIARLSVRFDRLEQSLAVCASNRELQLSATWRAKRDAQLQRQRAQHSKAAKELRHQLEAATRAAAASYRQATDVEPPLLHPQPLPNAQVATSYGTSQLGAVVADAKPVIVITKFKTAKPVRAGSLPSQQPSSAAAEETQPLTGVQDAEVKESPTKVASTAASPVQAAGSGAESLSGGVG